MRVGGEEEDGEGRGDRIGDADPRLDGLATAALESREHEEPAEREHERARHGERALAHLAVLVRSDHQLEEDERRRDAGGGQLRQGHAEEDHPPQDEVRADERADDPDEDAADEGIAEEEVGAQDLGEGAHLPAATAPKTSAIRSGASITSGGPLVALPDSTQMTLWTTGADVA